ncbi:unnamed protein product [Closterium sp. NIES-54]
MTQAFRSYHFCVHPTDIAPPVSMANLGADLAVPDNIAAIIGLGFPSITLSQSSVQAWDLNGHIINTFDKALLDIVSKVLHHHPGKWIWANKDLLNRLLFSQAGHQFPSITAINATLLLSHHHSMPPKGSKATKLPVDNDLENGDSTDLPAPDNSPMENHENGDNGKQAAPEAGSSGLSVAEKASLLTSDLLDDDPDELELDVKQEVLSRLRFTAILLDISPESSATASVQTLLPAFVAKTKFCRLQISLLHEADINIVLQKEVDYRKTNGSGNTVKCYWQHTEDSGFLREKSLNPLAIEAVLKNVPANISPDLLKDLLSRYKLKIRQQPPFLEGKHFHRVLHPVTGADTETVKGLVIPHPGDGHKWRQVVNIPTDGGRKILVHYPLLSCSLCGGHHYESNHDMFVTERQNNIGKWHLTLGRVHSINGNCVINPHLQSSLPLLPLIVPADLTIARIRCGSCLSVHLSGGHAYPPGSCDRSDFHGLQPGGVDLYADGLWEGKREIFHDGGGACRVCKSPASPGEAGNCNTRLSRESHTCPAQEGLRSLAVGSVAAAVGLMVVGIVSLLSSLVSSAHTSPEDPISDHGFAIRVAFRCNNNAKLGPGVWRLSIHLLNRPGVWKVVEAAASQSGGDYVLLLARLNAGLRAYAKEESKRVKATMRRLSATVATLKQALLGAPGCARTRDLLRVREGQLREYQSSRRDRLHPMAGYGVELKGEVASKHLSAKVKARKQRTRIEELKVNGATVSDRQGILDAAAIFFDGLFEADRRTHRSSWSPDCRLSTEEADGLTQDWSELKVKEAFKKLACGKSPGLDGIPKELFEQHWDVLGEGFMGLARSFSASASLPASTKEAVTILLHKKGDKDSLNNYRPITLLNFTYKVLARVVADRMKKVLHRVISKEQYGFIPGRRLSDAVSLVADIIDVANKGNKDWFLLLVDFQKAFDSVSRGFLFETLEKMGFPPRFVRWVKGLHKETRTRLLINDLKSDALEVVSGVRQGCPLAPYLFICAVEPLAQEAAKRQLGIVSDSGWRLPYLGYADDTTLLLQGREQIAEAGKLLGYFENISGLATNKEKSVVMPLGRNLGSRPWRPDGFKWAGADDAERLLGVYPPPEEVWNRITKLIHNFLSGNKASAEGCFILWGKDTIFAERREGGIGVRDPGILLACLAARRIGLLLTETMDFKRDMMLAAAGLPLGLDTFLSHEKLLKHWVGGSVCWKQTCECFMSSPLAPASTPLTAGEVAAERLVFNKGILLNGIMPVGGQQAAKGLWETRLGDLVEPAAIGGMVPVVGALRTALRMINLGRTIFSLGDLLFKRAASSSAFPEATLTAITIHQLWVERCETAFRDQRFRLRRVLWRIEAAFRLHARIFMKHTGEKLQKDKTTGQKMRRGGEPPQELKLLDRIRDSNVKKWTWKAGFAAIWTRQRRGGIRPGQTH